ncbi:DUF721 domain-containing protein [Fulvivirga sp. RKSG066]|uniref:DUF721 domain-containing protein n=1 Tax=Fulvivirga aurantia TaxID=2529383 RepID=UPI0012BBF127|nr:DUF721 domain-containing protein [Fulvivirga aurantia]MTI19459.1 DUF721 domain-containing protein [Fulvivirga aurantia]
MKKKDYSPRNKDITSVGDAINNLLQTYKINNRFDEAALISAWAEVMGKLIANRTERLFIRKDVLFVEITSAPLKHELNMSKQKIIDNFKSHLGKSVVSEIVFI